MQILLSDENKKSREGIQTSAQKIQVWNPDLFSNGKTQESNWSSSPFTLPDFQSIQKDYLLHFPNQHLTDKEIKLRPRRIKDPLSPNYGLNCVPPPKFI